MTCIKLVCCGLIFYDETTLYCDFYADTMGIVFNIFNCPIGWRYHNDVDGTAANNASRPWWQYGLCGWSFFTDFHTRKSHFLIKYVIESYASKYCQWVLLPVMRYWHTDIASDFYSYILMCKHCYNDLTGKRRAVRPLIFTKPHLKSQNITIL